MARVLLLPSPSPPLPDAAVVAAGSVAAEFEVELGVLEGFEAGVADVDGVLLEDADEVDKLVDDAEDESLLDVVVAGVAASAEVTTV